MYELQAQLLRTSRNRGIFATGPLTKARSVLLPPKSFVPYSSCLSSSLSYKRLVSESELQRKTRSWLQNPPVGCERPKYIPNVVHSPQRYFHSGALHWAAVPPRGTPDSSATNSNSAKEATSKSKDPFSSSKAREQQEQQEQKEGTAFNQHQFNLHHPHSYIHRWMTKQELLGTANGLLARLRIRFKWLLMRQVRPFNSDDISALFSWIVVGNLLWFLIGTTTFCSLILFALNSVWGQEVLARWVGNVVTKETGINVVFESAIVPHWTENKISFQKVFVSRRPGQHDRKHNVQKGSQQAAAQQAQQSNRVHDIEHHGESADVAAHDDGNYTQFDLTIDTVSVTLSLARWIDGKGILKDVEVKGLRGVVDRRHVLWDPHTDPTSYKHQYQKGDFELESFKMEDATVTLYQPGNNVEPFEVSIFSCDLPQLRKHWILYDFMSANNVSGSYDNSLFTVHSRKRRRGAGSDDLLYYNNYSTNNSIAADDDEDNERNPWKKTARLRIDKVDIKHLNRGVEGPFGWIESGTVDMLADVMLPDDAEHVTFSGVLKDIVYKWEESVGGSAASKASSAKSTTDMNNTKNTKNNSITTDTNPSRGRSAVATEHGATTIQSDNEFQSETDASDIEGTPHENPGNKYVVIDLRVQLNNPRAAAPLFTSDLTYINNALIHPIVGYINSRDTYIPVNCRLVKPLYDFAGSWTIYDSELMDDVSAELYDAFVKSIADDEIRSRRMRKVGVWSLQFAAQLFLLGLGALA